jgi:hypothetical protein
MDSNSRRGLVLMVWAAAWSAGACVGAAADNSWLVGRGVTVITWEARFMVSNTTVGKPELGDRYTVDKVNGDWLWIKSRGGYLKRSDVVLDEEAIDYFTRRINANASSANYLDRAVCWRKRGELEIAIGDFNEAIRLDPTNASAYNSRGYTWYKKGDYDKHIADYNEAIPQHRAPRANEAIDCNRAANRWWGTFTCRERSAGSFDDVALMC